MERKDRIGSMWLMLVIIATVCALLIVVHPAGAREEIPVTDIAGIPQQDFPGEAVRIIHPDLNQRDVRIGPSHVLYGLKLSVEDLDLSFTRVSDERVQKQIGYAQTRIAEVQTELKYNRTSGADAALARYRNTMAAAETTISILPSDGQALAKAQEMAAEQQVVLSTMVSTYQQNTGLREAFDGGTGLERVFMEKTGRTIKGYALPDNRVALIAVAEGTTPVPDQAAMTLAPVTTPTVRITATPVSILGIPTTNKPQVTLSATATVQQTQATAAPTPGATFNTVTPPPVTTPPVTIIPPTTEPTTPVASPTPTPSPTPIPTLSPTPTPTPTLKPGTGTTVNSTPSGNGNAGPSGNPGAFT